jgi:hypothetical protein
MVGATKVEVSGYWERLCLRNATGTIVLSFGFPCSCSKLRELWCFALDKLAYA